MVWLGMPGLGRAAGRERVAADIDSTAFADTAATVTMADTLAGNAHQAAPRRPVPLPESRLAAPRWVMLRSLVVPGWGQAYNHAWIKAALVIGAEAGLGFAISNDRRELDRLEEAVHVTQNGSDADAERAAVNAFNARLNTESTHQALLGVAVVYSVVDAYVDAHFRSFKVEFESDPALPGGLPQHRVRAGWEWNF